MRFLQKYKTYLIAAIAFCCLLYAHNQAGFGRLDKYLISPGDTLVFSVRNRYGDYFLYRSEPMGYQLDLIRAFAKSQHCSYRIVIEPDRDKRWKDLLNGEIDVVVCTNEPDSIRSKYKKQIVTSMEIEENTNSVWATSVKNVYLVNAINRWLAQYRETKDNQRYQKKYFESRMTLPVKTTHVSLSPYDDIIKRQAARLGWDWRLLASLVCQESRFQNDVISKRGAEGLMQVMPQTAELYGVTDLQNPEENLRAGVSYLQSLQKYFAKDSTIDETSQIKFVLASYNAGLGRIIDCRKFAKSLNQNPDTWDGVAAVIPLMKHEIHYSGDAIGLGRFIGRETLRFVDDIMDRYQHYQNLVAE